MQPEIHHLLRIADMMGPKEQRKFQTKENMK
jgi:hypothetical protein